MTTRGPADIEGDLTLNGIRCPLVFNPKTQMLAYEEGEPLNLGDGQANIPIRMGWDVMTPGPMGEVKRTGRDSIGYAHTVGMDSTGYGMLRLAGKRTEASTLTNLPSDLPPFGFEEALLGTSATTVGMASLTSSSSASAGGNIIQRSLTSDSSSTSPITQTLLRELNSTSVSTTYATASFTPTGDTLLLATVVSNPVASPPVAPTGLSGNGVTWVEVSSELTADNAGRVTVFRGLVASPSAGALTATFAASQNSCKISVSQFGNVDISGTNGSGAVVQSAKIASAGKASSHTVTLPAAFSNGSNATFGAFAATAVTVATNTLTAGSGFIEISDLAVTGRAHLGTEWRPSNDTSVDMSVTTVGRTAYWAGIAIEIKAGTTAVSSTTFTTASVTPTANSLVLLAIDSSHATAIAPSSVTGGGMTTWTQVGTGIQYNGTAKRMSLYRALQASPTTGPITIVFASAQVSCRWSVLEFQNVDTGGANGANAVVQVVTSSSAGATSLTVTLAAFGNALNATFGAFGTNSTGGITPGSGFTEVHDVASGGGLETEWLVSNDTSVDASDTAGASVVWGGIAIEIKANAPNGNYETAPISPSANKLILATVFSNSAAVATPTIAGNNLTWTQVATSTTGTQRITVFRALSLTTPTPGAITIDFAGVAQTAVRWSIAEFDGVDVTHTTQAVVQSATGTGTATTYAPSALAAFGSTSNAVYAAFGVDITSGVTPESNWTEIHEVAASSMTLETEYRVGSDTTATATGASATFVAVSLEISAATSAAASTQYVYGLIGRYGYKMSIGGATPSLTLTVDHEKDFGVNAQCGKPNKFGAETAKWYVPLGKLEDAQTLDAVSTGTGDTWSALTAYKAQAFAVTVQGAASALHRAFGGNLVNTSTDGVTFGPNSGFPVGNASETITNMIDSGAALMVMTDSNLHELTTTGVSRKLTAFPVSDKNSNFGAGAMVPEGSTVAMYNHRGIYFYTGDGVEQIDIDANELNQAIANVTFEPYRVTHYEIVYGSRNWLWVAARVTESSTTKTYLLAGHRASGSTQVKWDTYDRFDGIMRLIPVSGGLTSGKQLMYMDITNGKPGFYQLGPNAEPDPGRDSVGRGAPEKTYQWYGSRDDGGFPHTIKQLVSMECKTLDVDTTCPVQMKALRDHGAAASVGSAITSSTVTTAYFGTATQCYDVMPMLQIDTTQGYAPTTSDPKVLSVVLRAFLRPTAVRSFTFTMDTAKPLSDTSTPILDSAEYLSLLRAVERAAPVVFVDPDGNSKYAYVTDVLAQVKGVGSMDYIIQVRGVVWRES